MREGLVSRRRGGGEEEAERRRRGEEEEKRREGGEEGRGEEEEKRREGGEEGRGEEEERRREGGEERRGGERRTEAKGLTWRQRVGMRLYLHFEEEQPNHTMVAHSFSDDATLLQLAEVAPPTFAVHRNSATSLVPPSSRPVPLPLALTPHLS
eukprot:94421-Hanusia_phi.AAC.1